MSKISLKNILKKTFKKKTKSKVKKKTIKKVKKTKIIKLKITIKICEVIIIFPNSGFKKAKAMIIKVDLRNT